VDSFDIGAHHFAQEETSLAEMTNTFSGKLKTIFPSLFSTLMSWECDTLDSSNNQRNKNLKSSPSFSLSVRVYLLSGGVKPTLLRMGGFTQSNFSEEVAYSGEGEVTSVFEWDRGSK